MGVESSKQVPKDFSDLRKKSRYTIHELKQWHRNFLRDHPHGYITPEEFDESYYKCFPNGNASSFAEQAFRMFDSNGDGRIEFREFAIALGVTSRGKTEDKMRWMFSLYDINGDGYIEKREMTTIIKSLLRMVTDVVYAQNVVKAAEKNTMEIYKELDKNSDGVLTLEEFVELGNTNSILMDIFGVNVGSPSSSK